MKKLLLLTLLLGNLASCTSDADRLQELKTAQGKWENTQNNQNYSYTLKILSVRYKDKEPFQIEVINGRSLLSTSSQSRKRTDRFTVEALFNYIEHGIESENKLNALYDEEYGYPIEIDLRSKLIDGSSTLLITNFKFIEI